MSASQSIPPQSSSNLFKGNWTADSIRQILARHPRRPLLPVMDSSEWTRTAANPIVHEWLKPLRARAEAECGTPLPQLTDELYEDFAKTGSRLAFERVYFERRRQLARAAMSLLLSAPNDPWRERLTKSMIEKLTSIFEEVSWSLTAHINWDNHTGKDPLQIDLFCAETANLMAEMLDMFGSVVPASLGERIRVRLRSHIFDNYLSRHETVFYWTRVTHNWNAVCHQGILGAALSQLDDDKLLAEMLMLARNYLTCFISGFSKDGGCSEGPGYWGYGFGWFAVLNEQLETRTDGEISLFEGDGHIREIARFGSRFSLSKGKLVNFSDNAAEGGLNPALLAYLGNRLNESRFNLLAGDNYRRLHETKLDGDSSRCDVFYLGRLFLWCPAELPARQPALQEDCYLPDLAVLVARGTDNSGHLWEFAAKAGHNEEHHNHNDCGSFILNIDGNRMITEIGSPEYTKAFFGPQRYEFLATRSLGHSLPVINGHEQAQGPNYASRVVSHVMEPDRVEFVIDATACYPSDAHCRKFVRTFRFDKKLGKLTVEDAFDLADAGLVESAIISHSRITISGNKAVIHGDDISLTLHPLSGALIDRVETHHYKAHKGEDAQIHRLVLKPESASSQPRLTVEIELSA